MYNSLKWLLNDIIGYASDGNDIIVNIPSITISVRQVGSFISWIVVYKKKKFNLISEVGETDIVFQSLSGFINAVDMESNNADNS